MLSMLGAMAPGNAADARRSTLQWGVFVEGLPDQAAELDQLESLVGAKADIIMWYRDFAHYPDFDPIGPDRVIARGATPLLTWEPWDYRLGPDQPAYRLSTFLAGEHDDHLRRWAQQVARWGKPLMLRFGHEMNGNWSSWSESVNGNRLGEYRAVWQRVHRIFESEGATNVQWVWSPNVAYNGSAPLAGLYPGDDFVDWAAIDGYNWGPYDGQKQWSSYKSIFETTLRAVKALSARPLMIGEVASTEIGGNKAAWIEDFFRQLKRDPQVRAFVWFHDNKEQDWRITSSESARSAFQSGLSRR
jgi:hypothetical protein